MQIGLLEVSYSCNISNKLYCFKLVMMKAHFVLFCQLFVKVLPNFSRIPAAIYWVPECNVCNAGYGLKAFMIIQMKTILDTRFRFLFLNRQT